MWVIPILHAPGVDLSHQEIERDPKDPREYAIAFHFAENPFFSDAKLVRSYKIHGQAKGEKGAISPEELADFDVDRDLMVEVRADALQH